MYSIKSGLGNFDKIIGEINNGLIINGNPVVRLWGNLFEVERLNT